MRKIKALFMAMIIMSGSVVVAGENIPATQMQVTQSQSKEVKVVKAYTTKTGNKFHKANCKHLTKSKIEVNLKDTMVNKTPCKDCHTNLEYTKLMEEIKALKAQKAMPATQNK